MTESPSTVDLMSMLSKYRSSILSLFLSLSLSFSLYVAQSAGAVEYTDCTSAEG